MKIHGQATMMMKKKKSCALPMYANDPQVFFWVEILGYFRSILFILFIRSNYSIYTTGA